MPLLEFLCYLPASFCSSLSLSFHLPPSFLSISVFSSAGLVLTISETASFISSLTLFDPFDPFVFCGLCLSLFLTFGICDFSVMFCGLYSNFYFSKAEMRKRTEREKRKKGRQSESRTVRLPRKSVPCCPLHLPLLPFCLSLRALSLLPLFFLLPWCLLPLVCICMPVHVHYSSFVCVCEHANPCTRENPESWPPDKWPPSPPKLPVAETIKKSRQCCTHTKKGEKRTGDEEPSGEREQGRRTRPAVSSTMRTRAWQRLKAAPYECL